jgi:hypothetical protein
MEPSMSKIMEGNERLRELLQRTYTRICHLRDAQNLDTIKGLATAAALQEVVDGIDDALSQQAEPVCSVCSGDCGAANPPVMNCPQREQSAPAQDERSPERLLLRDDIEAIARNVHGECSRLPGSTFQNAAHNAILYALERISRPAQAEQQPIAWMYRYRDGTEIQTSKERWTSKDWPSCWDETPLYAAPVAQTELEKDGERFRHLMFNHVDRVWDGKEGAAMLTFGPFEPHRLRKTIDAALAAQGVDV